MQDDGRLRGAMLSAFIENASESHVGDAEPLARRHKYAPISAMMGRRAEQLASEGKQ